MWNCNLDIRVFDKDYRVPSWPLTLPMLKATFVQSTWMQRFFENHLNNDNNNNENNNNNNNNDNDNSNNNSHMW